VNSTRFEHWFDQYCRAFENEDADGVGALFAEECVYCWGPFNEPRYGRKAVARHHAGAVEHQKQLKFTFEMLGTTETVGVCRFWLTLLRTDNNTRVKYDGIFKVTLDEANQCSLFEEWYHWQETPA
jgi:ketosteroid isomerase-like protein